MPETPRETRVYTDYGKVAHLLAFDESPNLRRSALCGRSPSWFRDWLGTGSQVEHETAAALPLCRYCAKVADQPAEDFTLRGAGGGR